MKTYLFTDRLGAHSIWSLIDDIAEELIAQGNKVIYVRFDNWPDLKGKPVPEKVLVFDVKVKTKKRLSDMYIQYLEYTKELSKIIRSHQVDLIHTNFAIPSIYARLVSSKLKVPYVISTQHELKSSMSLHLRLGLFLTNKLVNHTVYISNTVANNFFNGWDSTPISKSSIISNGIDVAAIEKYIKPIEKRSKFQICCVGRMVEVKGQRILIQAMPKILEKYPYATLILIGDGPDILFLKEMVKQLDINASVKFINWIQRESVMEIVGDSSCMVIPSDGTQEGFGLVLAEAMALEVPIVCSDIPVFKEVAKSSVTFFRVNDINSLSTAVIKSLDELDLKRVNQAKQIVTEEYDKGKMVNDYIKLYQKVMNER
ncbi:TPA: glycosyltransferase family 4 protein [Vibrio parahaemolyticus]|nr:glycosyltransferase family 4 protein [Vibrio parahaemolyticus]